MNEIFTFKVQWLEWLISLVVLIGLFRPKTSERFFKKKNLDRSIPVLIFFFFVISVTAKYLQLFSLSLNAQDFWLFVDLLDSFNRGEYGVTHFAPQAFGPVQHGVIHPFLPWLLLAPAAKLFSSVGIGLVFGPACFSVAAYFLNQIGNRFSLTAQSRFLLVAAFLFSKHTSLTVMYDVHPESAYPLLALGMIWFLLSGKWMASCVLGLILGLLKEDSFMVIWGVGISTLFLLDRPFQKKKELILVFGTALVGYWIQMKMIQYFSVNPGSGIVPSSGPIAGQKWDGAGSILLAAQSLLEKNGGIFGSIMQFFKFLISDSWRSLLLQAPWCVLSAGFWISELPLAMSFSMRGEMAVFWNYYSAPFIAFFWVFAAKSLQQKNVRWSMALLFLTLVIGSESINLSIPQKEIFQFRKEASEFSEELGRTDGRGVVLVRLLPFVDLQKVISDRLPGNPNEESMVHFYFFEKNHGSYNVSALQIQAQIAKLKEPNSGFKIAKETGQLILFTKL